ncbi:MAG: ISAzo13-like element transposase-related protein [Acidiferrobacter sp.]
MGQKRYPHTPKLLITADGAAVALRTTETAGCRLRKVTLQELATRWAIPIPACHFPPGTS